MIDALPLLLGPEGYQISRSVRLRSSASAYLNRTPSIDGNRKKWTWSGWVKRGTLGAVHHLMGCTSQSGNDGIAAIYFSGDQLHTYYDTNTTNPAGAVGPAVYRDPSAWYHIVWAVDAANSIHYVYVNNVLVSTDTSKYPVNYDYAMNRAGYVQRIGTEAWGASNYFDGYLTEVNFIDGQALTPSSFGETNPVTGVWQPKKYTGTYGTNGFYLNFSDNSAATAAAIGKDYSGNSNNWTPNNISVTAGVTYDSMLDVPTQWADGGNGRGNYAVLNPLQKVSGYAPDNGNLRSVMNATGNIFATIGVTTGKWYWENIYEVAPNGEMQYGVALASVSTSSQPGNVSGSWSYSPFTGAVYSQSGTPIANVATAALNDVIGLALDVDAGTLAIYKNNSLLYTITSISGGTLFPVIGGSASINARTSVTFGQRPFSYTPPTGFKALNTLNLPTPTILKGELYMNATLWSGDSVNARVITTSLTAVDFAWVKKRNGIDDHRLANTVTGGNRHLQSNTTAAESTGTTVIQAFSGSTFTLGTDNSVNATGGTYVGWTWAEGATQGFDIVLYTGDGTSPRNISHNLGVTPAMVIVKSRSAVASWMVKHQNLSSNNNVFLESTAAQSSPSNGYIQNLTSSSTFGVVNGGGGVANVNGNGTTYVAYLFAAVAGYSAFGSYTGNGSADGPFVFCGFRPRWIMWKKTNSATNAPWVIVDTSRSPYNLAREYLLPNASDAETSVDLIDVLSNGFKWRGTAPGGNASGDTYIFAAFAENPLKFSLAR